MQSYKNITKAHLATATIKKLLVENEDFPHKEVLGTVLDYMATRSIGIIHYQLVEHLRKHNV
jgi:hypothetical protein